MESVCYYLVPEKKNTKSRTLAGIGMCAGLVLLLGTQLTTLAKASHIPLTSPVTSPTTWPIESPLTSPITTPIETTPVVTPNPTTGSTPTNNQNFGNTSNNNSNSGSNTCSDSRPATPRLYQIKTTNTTATLFITPMTNTVSGYAVAYGYKPQVLQFGITFPKTSGKGTVTYTIGKLSPNKTYYFTVRAINGCKTGEASNTLKATTTTRFARPRTTTAWEQMRLLVLSWMR